MQQHHRGMHDGQGWMPDDPQLEQRHRQLHDDARMRQHREEVHADGQHRHDGPMHDGQRREQLREDCEHRDTQRDRPRTRDNPARSMMP